MRRTDYADIAGRYEKNPIRHNVDREPLIAECLGAHRKPVRILDIACGTGIWLAGQIEIYREAPIEWFGIDASEQMLDVARSKRLSAKLEEADAENLPFSDGHFAIVVCNFALHHFLDKPRALAEARRTLGTGGRFAITNICPEYMEDSWIYRFFPDTRPIDAERFPTNTQLFELMVQSGFRPRMTTTVTRQEFQMDLLIQEAENRDASQLTLIPADSYNRGMEAMRSHGSSFVGSFALIRAVGTATT
ncbi:MAG: methyltransferase domain-containing protein [Spirochaetia bacterium]